MGRSSGTNADMVSVSGKGVKTATVSIPLRNMHTDCEILNLNDLNSVCDLIERYILSGGVLNA
jgi:endoglucanase